MSNDDSLALLGLKQEAPTKLAQYQLGRICGRMNRLEAISNNLKALVHEEVGQGNAEVIKGFDLTWLSNMVGEVKRRVEEEVPSLGVSADAQGATAILTVKLLTTQADLYEVSLCGAKV